MVKVLIGELFDSKAQTLVNTVNCVGIMGKGIALEFKKRFPEMFADYQKRCNRHEVKLCQPYIYKPMMPPWILNFPTKDHWRSVSRLEDIVKGLEYLIAHYKEWGITSLAVPPLGCGHGQLEWRIVGPTLYRHLSKLGIPIELYAPYGTPHEELQPEFLDSKTDSGISPSPMPEPKWIEPSWVALVEIIKRIEDQPYHWPVGRTIFQKIAFVATEEGLPTGLHYQRGSYGPFTPELKKVISRLVNNGLIEESKLGSMIAVKVGTTFHDARKAYLKYIEQWNEIIDKVVDLFMRMNTQQAEVVATVLFSADELIKKMKGEPSENDVLSLVMEWKKRRRQPLKQDDVAKTIRNLAALGWLKVKPSNDLPIPEEAWL